MVPLKQTEPSAMQTLALAASKRFGAPRGFRDAFAAILLKETGLQVASHTVCRESMDRELQSALRLSGFADNSAAAAATVASTAGIVDEEGGEAVAWSEDSKELLQLVQQLGPRNKNLCSEQFLKPFFRHLALPSLTIRELDEDVSMFTKLLFLDVSRNNLTAIQHLPPNLKYLKAYNNPITRISCKPTATLCFLGLGYSKMASEGVEQAARRFKNILALDFSYCHVTGLQEIITSLAPLPKLRQLRLSGSPVSLLPFYRLQVFRWLPQLHALDGVAATEEEQADAQSLAVAKVPLAPRPEHFRFGLQLRKLLGARRLLAATAEAIVATLPPIPEEELDPDAPPDPIVRACASGHLWLQIELPDGTWLSTDEYKIRTADELLAMKAAAGEAGPAPLDDVFLAGVGTKEKEPLYFDLGIGEEGSEVDGEVLQEDCLLRLWRWLRKGLAIKIFFRPAPPPPPEEAAASPAPTPPPAAPEGAAEEGEMEEAPKEPEPPKEVEIGGTVVCLEPWLDRLGTDMTPEIRESKTLPEAPQPWRLELPEVQVVLANEFLSPSVQVPSQEVKAQRRPKAASVAEPGAETSAPTSSLSLVVELHAGDAPPLEEEVPPPPPNPKAKGKAKAKAKK